MEKSDSDDSEGNTAKAGEGKKKAVFEVGGVLLHYSRKVGNMMAIIFSWKAHHGTVCNEAEHL